MTRYKPEESPYFKLTNRATDIILLLSILTGIIVWYNLTFTVNWNTVTTTMLKWFTLVIIYELFIPEYGQRGLTPPLIKIQCWRCPHKNAGTQFDRCMIYGGLYTCVFMRRLYLFDYCIEGRQSK